MRLHCTMCGKGVSNLDVPEDIIIRAVIICPECAAEMEESRPEE